MAVCVDMVISPALKGLEGVAEFANDVEEGLVVANVAWENDEGDALGRGVHRLPEGDDAWKHRASNDAVADSQPVGCDVGGRDAALGDDEARPPGFECLADDVNDSGGDGAGDPQALRRIIRPDQQPAGVDDDVPL